MNKIVRLKALSGWSRIKMLSNAT